MLELVINGIIIYMIFLRSYAEITKEAKHYFYLGGAAASIIAYVITGNFLRPLLVWGAVTWLILAFAFSQIGIHSHVLYKKKYSK